MGRRSRTTINPVVRTLIQQEARNDRTASGRQLAERVRRQLRVESIDAPVPKIRAIQVIARSARQQKESPDDPWSLGVSHSEIPPEAIGDILACWRERLKIGRCLTIREAKWIARLRFALAGEPAYCLEGFARHYAMKERTLQSMGGRPMDTADLDAELAFQPWKSALNEWEYDQAVLTGNVPLSEGRWEPRHIDAVPNMDDVMTDIVDAMGESKLVPKESTWFGVAPIPPFLGEARAFLREVGGKEIAQSAWWGPAETVMVLWLREITGRVKKWESIPYVGEQEVDAKAYEEWQAMGRRLAALVIAHAKGLLEACLRMWRPTELLKEVGYEM